MGDLRLDEALDQQTSLSELQEFCQKCNRCGLRQGACNVVFGEGNPRAKLVFVGEGPGAEEDRIGRPFVGAAGKLLDRIFAAGGWTRDEIYIANVVKCRPPGNRPPRRTEIESCLPLLQKQIELIAPRVIVAMGASAAKTLLNDPSLSITKECGRWHKVGRCMLMPTFHPAALLRDPRKKKPVWKDIQQVMAFYEGLQAAEGERQS